MSEYSSHSKPPTRRVAWRGVVTLASWYATPALTYAILLNVAPDKNANGQCEGLGFGCTPTPHDGLLLMGMAATPFLVLGLLVSSVALWIAVAAGARSGVAAGSLAALVGFAVAIAIPAAFQLIVHLSS
ncbi:MAG TPA: hypothetical protein VF163_03955 [Micromonosporaceae bacterium]